MNNVKKNEQQSLKKLMEKCVKKFKQCFFIDDKNLSGVLSFDNL